MSIGLFVCVYNYRQMYVEQPHEILPQCFKSICFFPYLYIKIKLMNTKWLPLGITGPF